MFFPFLNFLIDYPPFDSCHFLINHTEMEEAYRSFCQVFNWKTCWSILPLFLVIVKIRDVGTAQVIFHPVLIRVDSVELHL